MSYDPAKALALIASIEEERRAFEREIRSRTRLLSLLDEPPPLDPLIAGIEESWRKLSLYYHKLRQRWKGKRESADIDPGYWKNDWQYDGLSPISNAYNILLAMREHPALSGLIATDALTGKILLKGPIPLKHDPTFDDDFEMRPLKVADVTAFREYLQFIGLTKAAQEDVAAAIKLVATENTWRPAD